jgi:hypothetical protein
MPADKFGQYMCSDSFLKRANEAVANAVRQLEAKGVTPVYRARSHQDRAKMIQSAGEKLDDIR